MLSWSQFEQLYTLCVLGSLTVTVFFTAGGVLWCVSGIKTVIFKVLRVKSYHHQGFVKRNLSE